MLIGLHGRAGSGKDTVCSMFQEWGELAGFTVRRDAFADRLKLSVARLFHPDIELEPAVAWCNRVKESGTLTVLLEDEIERSAEAITGRELLQRYGTESHRDVFGTDFWVDAALHEGDADFLVLTDLRFENEAEAVRRRGGEVWQILREGQMIDEHAHASEQPLPPHLIDWRIINDADLNELRVNVFDHLNYSTARA